MYSRQSIYYFDDHLPMSTDAENDIHWQTSVCGQQQQQIPTINRNRTEEKELEFSASYESR